MSPELTRDSLDFVFHNAGFVVLADQQTVFTFRLSPDKESSILHKENLQDKTSSTVCLIDKDFFIESLLINHQTNSIYLTGSMINDDKSRVEHYDLATGKLLGSFSLTGANIIMEAVRANRLCFLGCNNACLRVMDVDKAQLVLDAVTTAVGIIFSIEVCEVVNDDSGEVKFVLALAGKVNDYSGGKTDLFDVTELLGASSKHLSHVAPLQTQLDQKDLEIARLKRKFAKKRRKYERELREMDKQMLNMIRLKVHGGLG